MSRWRAGLLILLSWGGITAVAALETDQFYAWGKELADTTEVFNEKVNVEIASVLEEINRRPSWKSTSCHGVVKKILPRFREFIFHEIELWANNSPLVERIPATTEEELEYREKYLYHITGPLDLGTKVPPSPTIELNGVRLGTDKLAHFFSEGWWYYKWYRKARRSGRSPEQAEARAIERGIFQEWTILGLLASGVFSTGDLEANHQGMRFLVGLCEGESPELQKTDDGWRHARRFDFRDYVTPEWDESYQPSVFAKRRWKKVRPVLIGYCPMLDHPAVIGQRRRYARRDGVTPTERIVQRLVERGKLRDPRQFTLESICTASRVEAGEADSDLSSP